MFLALRDLRFATGRFALMGAVVALISLLLVMLTGLTAGLGGQNTGALDRLESQGVQRLAFGGAAGQEPTANFTQSEVTAAEADAWRNADGVASAEPVGLAQGRAVGLEHAPQPAPESSGGADAPARVDTSDIPTTGVASVALLGVAPGSADAPSGLKDGEAVLGQAAADDLHAKVGDSIELSGTVVTVAAIEPTEYYSHTPVVWLSLKDWKAAAHAPADTEGTALAVRFAAGADDAAAAASADDAARTVSATVPDSYAALPAYSSENGSLMTMQGFLYGISALVVIAFLSIWTVQRTREIAVLKALGGSTGWVLRDALTQAGVVLLVGVGIGTAAAFGLGLLASQAVPFTVDADTVLIPAAGVFALGMLGAALAVARTVRIDPLVALGGN